jgi:flagellar biosynthesis protein FliQ
MIYKNLTEVAQASLEVSQGFLLPILGVCLAVSILFFVIQIVVSFQDLNFQFLIRLVLLVLVCVFMAKGVAEKFVAYTKSIYESAPAMVR